MRLTRLIGLILATLSALPLAASGAARSEDYPSRPITFVVPYAAGGGTDLLARLIAQGLEKRLGKPLVIDNRLGAGTVIATQAVARAAPDGYTLLMGTSTPMAINVTLYKNLPYNPITDLTPVALVAEVPFFLLVNPNLPVHSIADFVNLANATPGGITFATSGYGSAPHLFAELLIHSLGVKMTNVPYKGGALSVQDVIAGHVATVFSELTTALPLIRAGKVRALGVSTEKRVAAAPDIPPLAEAGVAGYNAAAWQMVVAPAGTPREILARLHAETRATVADPDVSREIGTRGMTPILSPPPEELASFVKAEIARWGKVVQQAGIAGSQ